MRAEPSPLCNESKGRAHRVNCIRRYKLAEVPLSAIFCLELVVFLHLYGDICLLMY